MNAKTRIWIVFLSHLCYEMEKTINNYLDNGRMKELQEVLNFCNAILPKFMADIEVNSEKINLESDVLLRLEGLNLTEIDLFSKVFGKRAKERYNNVILSSLSARYHVNDGSLYYYGAKGINFCYIDGGDIGPFPRERDQEISKRNIERFDMGFMYYFSKHIGLDFAGTNSFFSEYLPLKMGKKIKLQLV